MSDRLHKKAVHVPFHYIGHDVILKARRDKPRHNRRHNYVNHHLAVSVAEQNGVLRFLPAVNRCP
jgi:hypothetical protein